MFLIELFGEISIIFEAVGLIIKKISEAIIREKLSKLSNLYSDF